MQSQTFTYNGGNGVTAGQVRVVFTNDRHASIKADGCVGHVSVFTTSANVVVAIADGPDDLLHYVDLDDSKVGRWELVQS